MPRIEVNLRKKCEKESKKQREAKGLEFFGTDKNHKQKEKIFKDYYGSELF